MASFKIWLGAARLRTLPLSISGIVVGTAVAGLMGYHNYLIFILALCTTIGFQVTSNFANDYGDGVKGTDNEDRIGPKRALQAGHLDPSTLKKGILISIVVDIILVLALLGVAFDPSQWLWAVLFLFLGALSIWAAIRYTVGDKAYGYRGLGDVFVFVFFGLLAVLGTLFLYTHTITLWALLPAIAIGCLSTGVLNLNNLRDCQSDAKAGKNTLIVKMGYPKGVVYHSLLITSAFVAMVVFTGLHFENGVNALHLLAFIPIGMHLVRVRKTTDPAALDPELKKLALVTFLLSVLFYFSFNIFLYI